MIPPSTHDIGDLEHEQVVMQCYSHSIDIVGCRWCYESYSVKHDDKHNHRFAIKTGELDPAYKMS